MKLTILTQYFPPEVGAPQARLSELADRFAHLGHAVTILTAMPNYPTGKIFPGYGGLVMREMRGSVRVVRSAIYAAQSAGFIRRLSNYFSFVLSSGVVGSFVLSQSDFLMVESPPLFLGLTGHWLGALKHTRVIFNVSDLWPESAVRLGVLREGSLACKLSSALESFCYNRAWLVTGQSRSILESIRERFPSVPTYHLSNGVDTKRFGAGAGTVSALEGLRNGNRKIILYAGLHGLAQGLDQIVETAGVLRGAPDCMFALVGDGPDKEKLRTQAAALGLTNVSFLDPLPSSAMPALLSTADIILVPLKLYIRGAVPSKLYEAMASGKPVVLVAEGEAADIVRKHKAGMVVQPGDVQGIAAAVTTLLDNPELRKEMGTNGRCAAERFFDRSNIVDNFVHFLERSLEEHG